MKIISWNVNGINSTIKKGALDFIKEENADIYCLQEIKTSEETTHKDFLELEEYFRYWNLAEKKGYSGVITLSKEKPISVSHGIGKKEFDSEGRVLTLEFEDFFLVNAYFVNAQRGLARLDYKLEWNDQLLKYLNNLREKKNVILCGDLNVSHQEIDIKNAKSNKNNPGFSPKERKWFSKLLANGYIDTFRYFYPDIVKYSWWSYRNNARSRNIGWRLDYFVVNDKFINKIKNSMILDEVMGSDHCPILLEIE